MNYRVLTPTNNLSHEEWLEIRKKGLGGSDAAAILGLNPWRSAIDVWLEKTGREVKDIDSERMRIGRDLEDYVAQRFAETKGLKVQRRNAVLQHPEYDWMTANVDRLIVGKNEGLECKVTNSYAASDWKDKVPVHYELQCHHYMAVTGADAWFIAALVGNEKVVIHKIERDEDVIESLVAAEKHYWESYITTGEMPPPDGSEASDAAIKQLWPEASEGIEVELGDEVGELLSRRDELNKLGNEIDDELREIDNKIQFAMKDAEVASVKGRKITWKNRTQSRLDTKALKAEAPEIYEKYNKPSSFRVFLVK